MVAEAWLLETTEGPLAVALPELLAVVIHPPLEEGGEGGWPQQVRWQGQMVQVLDLSWLLRGEPAATGEDFLAILRYPRDQDGMRLVGLAGIPVRQPPVSLLVEDDQICPYPAPAEGWRRLALSCFRLGELAVPVADLIRMAG